MNNFFKKTSLLFLLVCCSELMYSQCVNPSVNLDAGNTQGFCAPIEISCLLLFLTIEITSYKSQILLIIFYPEL